jgi:FMN phosphatase YigB (HAD superfamily)
MVEKFIIIRYIREFTMLKKYSYLANFVYHATRSHGGVTGLARKAWAIYRMEGHGGLLRRLPLRRQQALAAARFRKNTYLARDLVSGELTDLRPNGGIAVIAHVYYPELFDQMAIALENIPWTSDCYLSVTNDTARKVVLARARQIVRIGKLEVRVVPNRGRDIAPLLVEFSKVIRQYRYVLHIHSKKSLYSGRERVEWRDYLFENLLGSERRIRHIFQQFISNPGIGLIYPDTFEGVPYWAHTWLQNRGIALTLAQQLAIDIEHCSYVDAPMGSMFWARVEALRPLLDLNLSYADFPEEQGQTDGTLQHTIERLFVPVAHAAGFSQRVMLAAEDNTTLFFSPGRKNLHHYYAVSTKSRILSAAASMDIVSFDIFDTLLVRQWFFPDNLFAYLDEMVKTRFGITDFARLRKQAERLARLECSGGDVDIDAIYTAFGKLCGRPEDVPAIRAMEESAELTALRPRVDVREAVQQLKARGKRVVLVSDMYLPEDFLRSVLAQHGIGMYDSLYLSCVTGLRKDRGDLWAAVAQKENVAPQRWLHVGDNEHSDLQVPLDFGYAHPAHVMRAADQFFLFNEEMQRWLQPNIWQEGLLLGLMANRIFLPGYAHVPISINADERSIEINSLSDFGYLVIGPVLTVFMAWLIGQARQDKIDLLLYASREGHLLKQAHDLIAMRQHIPEGQYFLCSRRVAMIAALRDETSISPLLKAHFKGSFADLLQKRLGIENTIPFLERLGLERMMRPGTLPEDSAIYRTQLLECLDLLTNEALSERILYQRYAEPLIKGRRSALVDIGYSATMQRALATFMKGIAGGYYFVTVEQSAEVDRFEQFAKGCFGHRINAFHADLPIYQFSLLLEAVLTAPQGQLLGFRDVAGNAVPHFKALGLAQQHFSDLEEIHKGALDFLKDALDISGDLFESLGHHYGAANLPIRQTMEYRWKLGIHTPALHVEDNYSGNEEISIFEFYDKKRERFPGVLD